MIIIFFPVSGAVTLKNNGVSEVRTENFCGTQYLTPFLVEMIFVDKSFKS